MKRTSIPAAVLLPIAAIALGACGGESSDEDGDGVSIVASTNVYGAVAQVIAGDLATVTSIIDSSAQDPHEYEASAQDRLAIDGADLIITNGGGYDSFIENLLESGDGESVVLEAVALAESTPHDEEGHSEAESGEHPAADDRDDGHGHIEGFNEHVWYDLHTIERVAEEISHELGEVDPDNADAYEANYQDFAGQVESLEAEMEALKATAAGKNVAITEPVPLYLLEEAGLTNVTPEDFSEAVEEGTDVSPRALDETLALFDSGQVAVLAYNTQTASETTEQVRAAAESASVPVVDFSETLPEGLSYVEWQQANIDTLAEALSAP